MLIERLSDIERINALELEFERTTGIKPFNVSSWYVSECFKTKFFQYFSPPMIGNAVDYVYSYSIEKELRNRALEKLGADDIDNTMILVTPNNTISIINAVNLIKCCGYKKVCIVNPSYFSVLKALQSIGLPYSMINMRRIKDTYSIPLEEILTCDCDAIWITSPVFSTGVYLGIEEQQKIKVLLNKGFFVVTDESFALHGYELIRQIGTHKNFVSIYSPHKSISCNGIKFSCIITSTEFEDFLEQWVDVLCGNLPLSSYVAFYHFLSDNFNRCHKLFVDEMEMTRRTIKPLLEGKHHYTDQTSAGSLSTIYFQNIPFEYTKTDVFFQNLLENTYSSIYPGWLNGFGHDTNLCFRINLALDGIQFRQSLIRIIKYLESL